MYLDSSNDRERDFQLLSFSTTLDTVAWVLFLLGYLMLIHAVKIVFLMIRCNILVARLGLLETTLRIFRRSPTVEIADAD